MNQSWRWPLIDRGAPDRLRRQGLCHAFTHCVANDFAREHVLHAGQVEQSFVGGK